MSVVAIQWVWASSVSRGVDRLVLLAIADCANGSGGDAWPSTQELAEKTGVSKRQVIRSIERLCSTGDLERERGAGRRGRNVYAVPVRGDTPSPRTGDTPSPVVPDGHHDEPEGGVAPSPLVVSHRHQGGDTPSPPIEEVRPVPSVPSVQRAGRATTKRRKPARPLPADWRPNDGHLALARELGVAPAEALIDFREHAMANDRRQADWDAAFRTWLRKALDFAPRRNGRPRSTPKPPEQEWMDYQ